MDRQQATRTALITAGGVVGTAVGAVGLLAAQVEHAKRSIGVRNTSPPYSDARYGTSKGPSIRLVMIGDSLATSLGARDPRDTMGARLATLVSEYDGRGVVLSTVAEVGARSRDLDAQIDRALHYRPHVAVVIIGGNDTTHMTPQGRAIKSLDTAVRRLRSEDVQVVVGTVPDLGTIRPFQLPLRWVARQMGRSLAAAQTECVVKAGGRAVSMGDTLGPEFDARPEDLFAKDRFHPSAEGYEAAAQVLAPSVIAALSRGESGEVLPDVFQSPAWAPLPQIAARAAELPGMEITSAPVIDKTGRSWVRWARMGRRTLPPKTPLDERGEHALKAETRYPGAEWPDAATPD